MKSRHIFGLVGMTALVTAGSWWTIARVSHVCRSGSAAAASTDAHQADQSAPLAHRDTVPVTDISGQPPPVPPRIARILTVDLGYLKRLDFVHTLGSHLSNEEIQALYAYLLRPAAVKPADRRLENWLRNDIMDQLVKQASAPPGLAGLLVNIYQDPQQDTVMRDYALQHMTPAYSQMNVADKNALRQSLWQAVADKQRSFTGTAMLALSLIASPSHPSPASGEAATPLDDDRAQLARTALRIADDERTDVPTRITALEVCAGLGVDQVLPLAKQLAQSAPNVPLRIAAIASLGDVGDSEAEALLQQIAQGPEGRLRPAAQLALRRLQERARS